MDQITAIRQQIERSREGAKNFRDFEEVAREGLTEGLDSLSAQIDLDAASLFLYMRRTQRLRKMADFNGGVNFIGRVRFDNGYGLSAWVAKKQQPIYLEDIHRGSRHGHAPVRSYLSMPILQDDDVLGVLSLSHIEPKAFERPTMLIVRNFAESLKPILHMIQRQHHALRLREKTDFARR